MISKDATFTSDWFSHNIPNWQRLFSTIRWDPNKRKDVIEIGSYEGRSSLWILHNLLKNESSRLHCVDTFPNQGDPGSYYGRFLNNIHTSERSDQVTVHAKSSFDFFLEFASAGTKVDFIYLDGSHQAIDVLEDLVLCFRLLKQGGLLICDDYLGGSTSKQDSLLSSPKISIDYFSHIYKDCIKPVGGIPLYQVAFIKTREKIDDDPSSRGK